MTKEEYYTKLCGSFKDGHFGKPLTDKDLEGVKLSDVTDIFQDSNGVWHVMFIKK